MGNETLTHIRRFFAAAFVWLLATGTVAHAQFSNQTTYAGAASGTNAQTITLPNMVTLPDILGVPITWVPAAGNTGATTLAINGGTATAVQKPSGSGLVALSSAELQAGQPAMTFYNGTVHILISINGTVNTPVTANYLANSALAFTAPYNLQCSAAVSANALTVSVLTAAGQTPSTVSPVLVPVRDVTPANGDPVIVSVTGALSITVPSGATIGTVSAQANRLWVGLFNNAGTPVLGVYNSLNSATPSVVSWDSSALATTTGITSGSGSSQTWYTSSAVAAKAFVPLCYVEALQTTAGTWAANPTKVQLFGPGVKKPGDVVQEKGTVVSSADTTSSATFVALTNNQISVTPQSAPNLLRLETIGTSSIPDHASGVVVTANVQLSRGVVAATGLFGMTGKLVVSSTTASTGPIASVASIVGYDIPGAAATYAVQANITGGFTLTYGGNTYIGVKEIQI
jgi:hypothetical protein